MGKLPQIPSQINRGQSIYMSLTLFIISQGKKTEQKEKEKEKENSIPDVEYSDSGKVSRNIFCLQ